MDYQERKEKFIQAWGALGASWGINKTMAQVHALLMLSPEALTTDDVMNELQISRGNASMTLRDLIDWGIVYKVVKTGERKEFYEAEKRIFTVAKRVVRERKKRELEPVLELLKDLTEHTKDTTDKEKLMTQTLNDIKKVVAAADNIADKVSKNDEGWFFNIAIKLLS